MLHNEVEIPFICPNFVRIANGKRLWICQQILEGKELLNERTDTEYKYLKKV